MSRPCRDHAAPMPCRVALIHKCHAAPLPFSDSAVSFVKFRLVAVNIRTASPTVLTDWNASDKSLRRTPRGSRKKPKADRSPTCRLWTTDDNSYKPCHAMPRSCRAHAELCRGLKKSLSERHGRSMGTACHVWIRHGCTV
jgi:hypothetical protein